MSTKYPVVPKCNWLGGLGGRYNDTRGNEWSVARLVHLSKDLKPFDLPLAAIDLHNLVWQIDGMVEFVYHAEKTHAADLSIPIILSYRGEIMDGWHRIARAISEQRTTIKAVRFEHYIEPDERPRES